MLRKFIPILFVILTSLTFGSSINWVENFEEGLKNAKESYKPVVLYFGSKGCKTCEHLKTGALSDEKVIKESSNYVFIHIDLTIPSEKTIGIFQKFSTKGEIPQLSFLSPNGQEIKSLKTIGSINTKQLLDRLEELKSTVFWFENGDDALEISKKKAAPLLIFNLDESKKTKDLIFEIDEMNSFKGYAEKFIWFKTTNTQKDGKNKSKISQILAATTISSVIILDSYSDEHKQLNIVNSKYLKNEIDTYYKSFCEKYHCKNLTICVKCSKTHINTVKCCGEITLKIKAFYCEKCETASPSQNRCCNSDKIAILK
ncbi:MAG: thioredoxin family protein [Planctomycetes bacterium]|nr:thioredoxin family protein [Planctomycetota bacterium]